MNMMKMIMDRKKKKDGMKEEAEHPKISAMNDIQKVLEDIAMDDEKGILEGIKGKKNKKEGKNPLEEMMEGEEHMEMPVAIIEKEGDEDEEEPEEHVIEKNMSPDGREEEEEEELDEEGKPIGFQMIKKRIMMGKK